MSAFAKMEVSGPEAREVARFHSRQPHPQEAWAASRSAICLTPRGGVRAEFTVYEWAPGRFYLVSAGAYRAPRPRHAAESLLPTDGSVHLNPITTRLGVLVLAGPNSRKVLQKLTDTDLSNEAFPWLSGQPISVGHTSCHALRVNFVGELGWEFHHPIEQQNALFDLLMEAGKEFGIRPYGIKAMSALSIEKSYRLIPRELSIEYSAYESGLDRFVHPNKGDFIGRDALVKSREKGLDWNFVTWKSMASAMSMRAAPSRSIRKRQAHRPRHQWRLWLAGEQVTGAGHGQARIRARRHAKLEIKILDKNYVATIINESPYDPDNAKLRA